MADEKSESFAVFSYYRFLRPWYTNNISQSMQFTYSLSNIYINLTTECILRFIVTCKHATVSTWFVRSSCTSWKLALKVLAGWYLTLYLLINYLSCVRKSGASAVYMLLGQDPYWQSAGQTHALPRRKTDQLFTPLCHIFYSFLSGYLLSFYFVTKQFQKAYQE